MLPFLVRTLGLRRGHAEVIDLGAGSGCDAVGLAQRGFKVIGNEVDPVMLAAARQLARRAGQSVRWQAHDWRTIGDDQPASVAAAYLVGNSFCLLDQAEDRAASARQFARLLAPGGRLLVDERNFEYILRERAAILRGHFRYTSRVVYCGRTVSAAPARIADDRVVFQYRLTASSVLLGDLAMYPFRRGELVRLFTEAGLTLRAEYSDLQPGYAGDADFHAYLFERLE